MHAGVLSTGEMLHSHLVGACLPEGMVEVQEGALQRLPEGQKYRGQGAWASREASQEVKTLAGAPEGTLQVVADL